MHITAKYGNGCSDATCPAIYDTDDPQALHEIGQVPPHETVVLLPRKLFEDYRSRA